MPDRETPLIDRLASALADRYRIERELGGGGMSRVFVARERSLNRDVVIKLFSADLTGSMSGERFAREIQLAASLQQANIVPLLAAGEADGVPYFTMPFVEGESLRRRLASGAAIPITECVAIARDVARALSYAHTRGVVHRDIKPDNILLSHGAAMVTDFGIAKAISAARGGTDRPEGDSKDPAKPTRTSVGMSLGTPAYMAPEQIAGDPDIGPRADLYAWACLTYELLTGHPPFVRSTAQRVGAAHLSETPAPIAAQRADVPPSLERLVIRCLSKEPQDRPASADDILPELDAVATPGGLATPSTAVAPRRTGRRQIIAVVAVLALAAATALFVRTRGRTAPVPAGAPAPNDSNRSIAVLPLTNLSADKADDYFGIGLAEEMTGALAKTGVRVIGRVSAGALMARGLDARAIARELGVGSLLTGTVQRAADQVRINVSLVSATDGAVRWTEKDDRPLTNVFAVQDEIAHAVAARLLGSLGGPRASTAPRVETEDPQAYALFLQGKVLFNRRTAPTLQQATSLFEQAVARDPKYARAQAGLAMTLAALPSYIQGNTDADIAKAAGAAQHANAGARAAGYASYGRTWTAPGERCAGGDARGARRSRPGDCVVGRCGHRARRVAAPAHSRRAIRQASPGSARRCLAGQDRGLVTPFGR